jgi:hypothetical protein
MVTLQPVGLAADLRLASAVPGTDWIEFKSCSRGKKVL